MLLLFAAIYDTEDWNVTGAGEGAEEGTSAWDDKAVDDAMVDWLCIW